MLNGLDPLASNLAMPLSALMEVLMGEMAKVLVAMLAALVVSSVCMWGSCQSNFSLPQHLPILQLVGVVDLQLSQQSY